MSSQLKLSLGHNPLGVEQGSRNLLVHANLTTTPGIDPSPGNDTPLPSFTLSEPVCQAILYDDIGESRVRVWDLIVLIPNIFFLAFLLYKSKSAIAKLRSTSSPIFTAFYVLVCLVALISVLRCVVSMTVNASVLAGDIADKVLWLVLRFFLLATEMSIIVFGLAFGHLDSRKSIQRVLLVTSCVALLYSCTQGTLEFEYPDPQFHVEKGINQTYQNFDIFAHGGMIFWITSSLIFFVVYIIIFILPWTSLKERWSLPPKKSFYRYAAFLALLNLTQAVGSGLLYGEIQQGMCIIDLTSYIYFTCFVPLVYLVFLRKFFMHTQPRILFSYKSQVDEAPEDDTVSMPYQTNVQKSEDTESINVSFDSTHFDHHSGSYYTRPSLLPNGSINATDQDMVPTSDYYQASA
ncbi:transmembrane protein adipocyte-associated 1-like [Ostrea edulis]|uniref:transmembrane protein adipocyte-associated 1-like n=1 Tax=Ostrea edulis TaxID=37623 RepID=UPI002094EB0A|nr:transmembrane protein adipocyte-associated 1-like [Ostrea edulis]XP_048741573.1 transmembrane protein adipocyte-associated 1-like [Ostrea edulis]